MFYCYQYITVVHFVAKVGTLIGENRYGFAGENWYGFAGENWYTLFYCLHHDTNTVVWAAKGHGKSVLEPFFKQLSSE